MMSSILWDLRKISVCMKINIYIYEMHIEIYNIYIFYIIDQDLSETNIHRVGRQSFPFWAGPIFRGVGC